MEILFGLVAVVSLIAAAYFAVRAAICKAKKNGGAGAAVKKAGISAVVFFVSLIICAQMSSSEKAEQPAQETAQTAQQAPAKEEKAAEPEQTKAAKQIDTPVVYDVAADKQSLTDYVNSTVGAKYKITNLNVSEYSDGVYQIMFECRDSKYSDAESAKTAGKEIRELMSGFPCNVNLVAITFKGGLITYDPASPRMQIVAEGKKSEF